MQSPCSPFALTLLNCCYREKKLAAKAQGRRHASSDEDESEVEAAEEDEGASAGEEDPFFQHEDNPFDDPFFRVCSHAKSNTCTGCTSRRGIAYQASIDVASPL